MHNHRINKEGQKFYQRLSGSDINVPASCVILVVFVVCYRNLFFPSFSAHELKKLNNKPYVKNLHVAFNNYRSNCPKNLRASFDALPVISPCCSN